MFGPWTGFLKWSGDLWHGNSQIGVPLWATLILQLALCWVTSYCKPHSSSFPMYLWLGRRVIRLYQLLFLPELFCGCAWIAHILFSGPAIRMYPPPCVDSRNSSGPQGELCELYKNSCKSLVCVTGLWSLGDECNQLYLRTQSRPQSESPLLSRLITLMQAFSKVLMPKRGGGPIDLCSRSAVLPRRSWRSALAVSQPKITEAGRVNLRWVGRPDDCLI